MGIGYDNKKFSSKFQTKLFKKKVWDDLSVDDCQILLNRANHYGFKKQLIEKLE